MNVEFPNLKELEVSGNSNRSVAMKIQSWVKKTSPSTERPLGIGFKVAKLLKSADQPSQDMLNNMLANELGIAIEPAKKATQSVPSNGLYRTDVEWTAEMEEVAQNGDMSKNERFRQLHRMGVGNGQIARMMGVKTRQQVVNAIKKMKKQD